MHVWELDGRIWRMLYLIEYLTFIGASFSLMECRSRRIAHACVWLSSSCILTNPLRQLRELIDLLFDDCMLMSRSVALRRDVTHVPLETLHPFRSSRFERRCCCFFSFFCLISTQTHLLRCSRYFSSRQKPVSRVLNLTTVARFLWDFVLLWQMVLQWSGSDTGSVEIFAER